MIERERERGLGLQTFRSHVPVIRNGKILQNMISNRVDGNA